MAQPGLVSALAIIGAHSAMGQAVSEAFDSRDLASLKLTTTEHIQPGLDLISPESISKARWLFVCSDEPVVQQLAEGANRLSAQWVDLAGVMYEAPLWIPFLGGAIPTGPIRMPLGPAWPILSVLKPLEGLGLLEASVTTVESVAGFGSPGFEELSAQARAVFTGADAPTEVLGVPLAFNLLTHPLDDDGEESMAEDLRVYYQGGLRLLRTHASSFSGESVLLDLKFSTDPSLDTVQRALDEAPMVRRTDTPPRSLAVQGRADVVAGRLSVQGAHLRMALVYDRLVAGTATLAAVLAERGVSG